MPRKELDVLAEARAAGEALKATAAGLVRRHTDLNKERGTIWLAPAPQAEALANAERLVDQAAREFASTHGRRFALDLGGGPKVIEGTTRYEHVGPHLPAFGPIGSPLSFETLCGIAPALVKARIAEILKGAGPFGQPASARESRIAEIDREVASIEAEHRVLLEGAREFGVELEEIPVVKARQYTEARKAEEEEWDAQCRRAEALREAQRAVANGDRGAVATVELLAPQVAADRQSPIGREQAHMPRPTPSVAIQ
jgi:hypothetical protein